jgi:hypothetical protein
MSLTALDLSPEALKKYCLWMPSAAARQNRRHRSAIAVRQATKFLKSEFGDKEVILFGSLVRRAGFSHLPDLDDLRKFRHLVRNVYTHHLDSVQLGELVKRSTEDFAQLQAETSTCARFLEQ